MFAPHNSQNLNINLISTVIYTRWTKDFVFVFEYCTAFEAVAGWQPHHQYTAQNNEGSFAKEKILTFSRLVLIHLSARTSIFVYIYDCVLHMSTHQFTIVYWFPKQRPFFFYQEYNKVYITRKFPLHGIQYVLNIEHFEEWYFSFSLCMFRSVEKLIKRKTWKKIRYLLQTPSLYHHDLIET